VLVREVAPSAAVSEPVRWQSSKASVKPQAISSGLAIRAASKAFTRPAKSKVSIFWSNSGSAPPGSKPSIASAIICKVTTGRDELEAYQP
jgi:hypothetical protein